MLPRAAVEVLGEHDVVVERVGAALVFTEGIYEQPGAPVEQEILAVAAGDGEQGIAAAVAELCGSLREIKQRSAIRVLGEQGVLRSKCVAYPLDLRLALVRLNHRDDVEPAGAIEQMIDAEVVLSDAADLPALGGGDGAIGREEGARPPRLHFHKADHVAIESNDVDLASAAGEIALEDLVAVPANELRGGVLAHPAESLPGIARIRRGSPPHARKMQESQDGTQHDRDYSKTGRGESRE